jgi:hypothetical protein
MGTTVTLHILISGRERFAAPFYAENLSATARALDEHLSVLRQLGRTAVYVNDDDNVAHIIVAG